MAVPAARPASTGGDTGGTTTDDTGGTTGGPPGTEDDEGGDPTDPYEPIGDDGASQDDDGDGGDKKKECSGFWGCTLDQLGQVGEGIVVDGLWGDVTDTWDTIIHPIDSVTGLWDYGKTLDDPWHEGTQEAA